MPLIRANRRKPLVSPGENIRSRLRRAAARSNRRKELIIEGKTNIIEVLLYIVDCQMVLKSQEICKAAVVETADTGPRQSEEDHNCGKDVELPQRQEKQYK